MSDLFKNHIVGFPTRWLIYAGDGRWEERGAKLSKDAFDGSEMLVNCEKAPLLVHYITKTLYGQYVNIIINDYDLTSLSKCRLHKQIRCYFL